MYPSKRGKDREVRTDSDGNEDQDGRYNQTQSDQLDEALEISIGKYRL